jgi:hypothetical protein
VTQAVAKGARRVEMKRMDAFILGSEFTDFVKICGTHKMVLRLTNNGYWRWESGVRSEKDSFEWVYQQRARRETYLKGIPFPCALRNKGKWINSRGISIVNISPRHRKPPTGIAGEF